MSGEAIGFAAAGVAILCFGSNFVPIKKFETGDGVFFQWILCVTIWMAGLIVNCIRHFPPFQPIAMLGGFLWCTGNMLTVPIIKCIGLSLGMLVWGLTNLLAGWSSGTFGLFGLHEETVAKPVLNYLGVVFCCASLALYLFVKSDVAQETTAALAINTEEGHLLEGDESPRHHVTTTSAVVVVETSWVDRLTTFQKRVVGLVLSVVAGVFYGTNFDPPQYIMDNQVGAHYNEAHQWVPVSKNGLDYVFSHFSGILVTSTIYMLIYCIVKKNKPDVYPQVILPAVASGTLWAIADICWFVANSELSFVVAFPMITTGPGVIASLWGIFAFREFSGRRNFLFLGGAFTVTIVGVLLIALSRMS